MVYELQPGDAVHGDEKRLTTDASNADEGDPVALSSGGVAAADTDANDLAGIVSGGGVVVEGTGVVAAVDAGITEGQALNAGNTTAGNAGVLIADSAGNALALSDEGGTYRGYSVPAGYAVIEL